MSNDPQKFDPENQQQRWMKYGLNVLVAAIVVVLLAGMSIYLAQRFHRRVDTTATGLYSLKPQTVNLVKDLSQKIKLVSLYSEKDARGEKSEFAEPVRDLLGEYASNSSNIEYEAIDPISQPGRVDALIADTITRYGGAVGEYRTFLTEFQEKSLDEISRIISAEAAAAANVKEEMLGSDERGQTLAAIISSIRMTMPKNVEQLKENLTRRMRGKFPNYRDIADEIRANVDALSRAGTTIIRYANQYSGQADLPQPVRDYLTGVPQRMAALTQVAEAATKKIDGLGELKVGELQQAIKQDDLILVLGETDWRVIEFEKVWVTNTEDIRAFTEGREPKARFAGEQSVTSAILALKSPKKPKVVFMRPGGAPLTAAGASPFQRGGPLSDIASRLRAYNFDVLEKDLSGSWAMQAQMRGMPAEPEPSDEEVKDAVWIVLNLGAEQGPAAPIGAKLAAHLKAGGSALILAAPQADNLSEALRDYGIELQTDVAILHELPSPDRQKTSDWDEEVQAVPIVFVVNQYGKHALTAPLNSLDSLLAWPVPVKVNPMDGVTSASLLPMPTALKSWGERQINTAAPEEMKFDETGPNADMLPPFFAGAAAQKGESRVVVIGGLQSFTNQILNWPDNNLLQRGIYAARFPGNAELINNSVFWLSKLETMIAISPAAMEVSRIAPMSDAMLSGWRMLLMALPVLVLAAGVMVYYARRD